MLAQKREFLFLILSYCRHSVKHTVETSKVHQSLINCRILDVLLYIKNIPAVFDLFIDIFNSQVFYVLI